MVSAAAPAEGLAMISLVDVRRRRHPALGEWASCRRRQNASSVSNPTLSTAKTTAGNTGNTGNSP